MTISQAGLAMRADRSTSWIRRQGDRVTIEVIDGTFEVWSAMRYSESMQRRKGLANRIYGYQREESHA